MQDAKDNETVDTPCFMSIMGSFQNHLLVYKDVRLAWTAKTMSAPIFIETVDFDNQKGLLVTLSDDGYLQVSYLGMQ